METERNDPTQMRDAILRLILRIQGRLNSFGLACDWPLSSESLYPQIPLRRTRASSASVVSRLRGLADE